MVGHRVTDPAVAKTYLEFWTELSGDPVHSKALTEATTLTPNPPNVIRPSSNHILRHARADNMLDWYGQRMRDAASLVMMTIPFNVANTILKAFDNNGDAMRLVVLEDVPTADVLAAEKRHNGKLSFSNGAVLRKSFVKFKSSFGGAKVAPIANSKLDQWFADEEMARPTNTGHVFFVHAKVLYWWRSTIGGPTRLLWIRKFFCKFVDRKRRKYAAHPRQYPRRRYLYDGDRPHLPPFLCARYNQ